MTIPAIFYATDSPITAAIGFVVAVVASLFTYSLVKVASLACIGVLISEIVMKFI
jgi:hypothetical protein